MTEPHTQYSTWLDVRADLSILQNFPALLHVKERQR